MLVSVIAILLAGSVAADNTVYGKVRLYLELGTQDGVAEGKDQVSVQSFSSRIGFKGSDELDNGLSSIYVIEAGVGDEQEDSPHIRLLYAGIKGDFGQAAIGSQWTPSYVLVRGVHDPFDTGAGGDLYGGGFPADGRIADAISFTKEFGDVSVAAAVVADEGSNSFNDQTDIAVSLPVGPFKVGVAFATSSAAGSPSPVALNLGWVSGVFAVDLGYFMRDQKKVEAVQAVAGVPAGPGPDGDFGKTADNIAAVEAVDAVDADTGDDWMVLTGSLKTGSGKIIAQFENNGTDNQFSAAYLHSMSKRTSLFAELTNGDMAMNQFNVGIMVNFYN